MTMEFTQTPPSLGNQFDDDRLLNSYLEHHLPSATLKAIVPDLRRFGDRVVGDILCLGNQAETEPPVHVPYDPWGKRIDHIKVSPAWVELEKISAEEGLVAIGHERKYGEWSRIYQFAKLYLFHPSSAVYTCPLAMTDGAARIIELHGTPAMKERAHRFLTSRDPRSFWTSGQWMTEKTGGSDVSGTSTVARKSGDTWKLYGQKWFTSATTSQMAVTLAKLEGDPSGKLSLFYLELRDGSGNLQGITINRLKDKLGTKALPTAELTLDGAEAVMIGEPGRGVKTISGLLNITRLYNAICALGAMRRGIALSVDYAGKREAFGRKLIDHPLHVNTLAQLQTRFEASFHLTFHALKLLGKVETGVATETEDKTLRLLVPLAKLFVTKEGVAVTSEVLEAFGGAGYIEDTHLPELLRNSQVLAIWEGTTNVLSLDSLRAIQKEDAGGAFLTDLLTRLNALTTLTEEKALVLKAAQELKNALTATTDPENLNAKARDLAMSMARTYAAALMLEHAEILLKNKDHRGAIAARRWIERGLVNIPDQDDERRSGSLELLSSRG